LSALPLQQARHWPKQSSKRRAASRRVLGLETRAPVLRHRMLYLARNSSREEERRNYVFEPLPRPRLVSWPFPEQNLRSSAEVAAHRERVVDHQQSKFAAIPCASQSVFGSNCNGGL